MYAKLAQTCLSCKEPGKKFYNYAHERMCTDCMRTKRKAGYQVNKEKVLKRVSSYRKNNPDKIKHTKLKQTYGITLESYQIMLLAQNNVCAICERPEETIWRGQQTMLAVDHDHNTGAVRGLLCQKCNRALGLLEENRRSIDRLGAYIDKHKS